MSTGPSDPSASEFLGLWTYTRMDDEAYHAVLAAQNVPWAIRKLLQAFTAQRDFIIDESGQFLFRSKMLTGSWNELHADSPTTFTLLGYTVDTLVTWEQTGKLLVSTMKTKADDGYFTSGCDTTTRITHQVKADELEVATITPEGTYTMWFARDAAPAAALPVQIAA